MPDFYALPCLPDIFLSVCEVLERVDGVLGFPPWGNAGTTCKVVTDEGIFALSRCKEVEVSLTALLIAKGDKAQNCVLLF
jgi:hypothetical protein